MTYRTEITDDVKIYQITFVWPNDDWTWIDISASDFQEAMCIGLAKCPISCRVQGVSRLTKGFANLLNIKI